MNFRELFPQKLALGDNFCNRIIEKERLIGNIEGVRPTLIMSPRRYGKTSLVIEVCEKHKAHYTHLDLFPLATCDDVENTILGGIGKILTLIESNPQKAFKSVSTFFSELSVSFKIINSKIEIDFNRNTKKEAATILSALTKLDATLKKKKKKAVIFLDEFQRLSQMQNAEAVEGAIRHVAQRSNYIIFLFSGSNRHLLSGMFDDRNRPLYKLCDRMILDRIGEGDYTKFIQKMAKKTKRDAINHEVLETIYSLTQRHPYYINVLCSRLWRIDKTFAIKDVHDCWYNYCLEEKSTVFKELEALSSNQIKLLITFARNNNITAPLSDDFLILSRMALSSTRQALKVLQEKDYLYRDDEKVYRVLDPLIQYILLERPN